MLAANFTDLHVHTYQQHNKGYSRLENCLGVIDQIYSFCETRHIDLIMFEGDMYDNQKLLPTVAVNRLIKRFTYWIKRCPQILFVAISGNHDYAAKNIVVAEGEEVEQDTSAMEHLAHLFPDNFKLIDNSSLTVVEGITIHGIPYYEYPEHFDVALSAAAAMAQNTPGVNLLMMHQTPSDMGNDMIPADFDVSDPRLESFDYVYCGHIHKQMQLKPNLLVVGSPIHRDAADIGIEKGFIVTDISAPQAGWKFISLRGKFPEYVYVPVGTEIPEEHRSNYVVWQHTGELKESGNATAEEFSSDLSPQVLMENYWKQVDGKDEKLLKTGINLLTV